MLAVVIEINDIHLASIRYLEGRSGAGYLLLLHNIACSHDAYCRSRDEQQELLLNYLILRMTTRSGLSDLLYRCRLLIRSMLSNLSRSRFTITIILNKRYSV